jgi:hypothetical protein
MAGTASKKLRQKREAAPLPPSITVDEIQAAIEAENRTRNSYHSLSAYVRKHIGCTSSELEPPYGTFIHRMWSRGQLRYRQLKAWQMFTQDLERSYGNTGPLCASYSDRIAAPLTDTINYGYDDDEPISGKAVAGISLATWNSEHSSLQQKYDNLRREERGLIEQLIRDYIRATRGIKIHCHDAAYIGSFISGYTDNRQCIAAFVSRVQAILSSLADMYMIVD